MTNETKQDPIPTVGVSGFGVFLPRFRVPLEQWCQWTGNDWNKITATVGNSFRVCGPHESIYTMAANAALRLILNYNVDPRSIGFIGLGTESSSDNSAGAVLVKGMLDQALESMGLPRISRHCEVPEFKQACLGGVYALKAAIRYVSTDGRGRKAIAISADIAEYERGSSGEPTQGAGAVAQLVEEDPKLYSIDLNHAGSASAYRGVDFRKPHRRHLSANLHEDVIRFPDYPVFNGRYSTICFTDEAIHATARMIQRLDTTPRQLYNSLEGAFMHRPYHRLPTNVMAALYVWGLTRNDEHLTELEHMCALAGADFDKMCREAKSFPDLFEGALGGHINKEVYPESMKVVKYFRDTVQFKNVRANKLHLGVQAMKELGNLYTASLPAWIAVGLEEAMQSERDIAGRTFFTLGYGSGDAAEAMMIWISKGWKEAAAKIDFAGATKEAINLKQNEYEALHDGLESPCPAYEPSSQFIVDHIGHKDGPNFQDLGIEYYSWVP